jgi:hypothetical protein
MKPSHLSSKSAPKNIGDLVVAACDSAVLLTADPKMCAQVAIKQVFSVLARDTRTARLRRNSIQLFVCSQP